MTQLKGSFRPSASIPTCAVAIIAASALAGCERAQQRTDSPATGDAQIEAYIDPATGCQYLIYSGGYDGGITSRLGPDGKPICQSATGEG